MTQHSEWTDDKIYEWIDEVTKYTVLHNDRIVELVSRSELVAFAMTIRDDLTAQLAQARKNEASWRAGYGNACQERDEVREKWIAAEAELARLRAELAEREDA